MRTCLALTASIVCLSAIKLLCYDQAGLAASGNLAALLGGKQCYYRNAIACQHALSATDCLGDCEWDQSVGPFGTWVCPEGMDQDVKVRELSTTIKTGDVVPELGWHADQEKAEAEDCNTIYMCGCNPGYVPGSFFFDSDPPQCGMQGNPLPSPQGTFREPVGEQTCLPEET